MIKTYHQADAEIHLISQLIAKFNRTCVSKEEDDSHTNFYFDPLSSRLYGRWAEIGNKRLCLSFNLKEFAFELLDDSYSIHASVSAANDTIAKTEQTLAQKLSDLGVSEEDFRADMHYEIPEFEFADQPLEKWSREKREIWTGIRELANRSCFLVNGYLVANGEIRIWPHHFDTGVYNQPNAKRGLGFGLATKDSMAGEAYFYFSGYSLNDETIDYSQKANLSNGYWELSENWKGAILPISELEQNAEEKVETFIKEVTPTLIG
jgi:hypothetical protein